MLNEILQIISMVLCLVGILQVLVGPKRWRGSVFFHIIFYIALFNYAISILLGLILEGHEGELVHHVMIISNFLEFISGYSLTFFVIKWLLHCVDPMREVKEIRVRNLISDLRASLKSVGQEAVLIRKSGLLAIKRDSVDCDYYRMLVGDMEAVNSFRCEYMKQFVWAQDTEAKLHFRK